MMSDDAIDGDVPSEGKQQFCREMMPVEYSEDMRRAKLMLTACAERLEGLGVDFVVFIGQFQGSDAKDDYQTFSRSSHMSYDSARCLLGVCYAWSSAMCDRLSQLEGHPDSDSDPDPEQDLPPAEG